MRKKISDPSIKATVVPKGEFNDRWTILQSYGMPIPEHFIDEMREILRVWSDKETSLRMKDFLVENRIASSTFYTFVERSEKFKQEYEWTLAKIASRREIGAMTGKLHPIAVRMMPRYDQEWTENEEKLETIKKISQATGTGETKVIFIQQNDIPSSPLVPELKKDNDE